MMYCSQMVQGRCLYVKAAEAAVSGHSGAQLAVLEDSAVGARVKVTMNGAATSALNDV